MLKRMKCREFQCLVAQIKQSYHFSFHVHLVDNAIFRTLRVAKTYFDKYETHYPTARFFALFQHVKRYFNQN